MAGLGFSPGSPVSSTNKTDSHDITTILLSQGKPFKIMSTVQSFRQASIYESNVVFFM
jgi:hypothetical protein